MSDSSPEMEPESEEKAASDDREKPDTPAGDGAPADAEHVAANPLEALQAENAELKDRLLRSVAEVENVRKRLEKERNDAAKFGIAGFCRDLISVADNFERALTSIGDDVREGGGEPLKNFIVGIEMTERELVAAFEKNGLAKVRPGAGEKFDPNHHQAIAEIPSEDHPAGTIVEVTQTGYSLETRLIRPAMVVVSKGAQAGATSGKGGDKDTNDDSDGSGDLGGTINTTV